MKAIILAAGIGSRLGNLHPKPLTKLSNGESILKRQIKYLSEYIGINIQCIFFLLFMANKKL